MNSFFSKGKKLVATFRKILLAQDGTWRAWTMPAVLALVAFLSFGIYARRLGFYWDDWSLAWDRYFRGPEGVKAAFMFNRPIGAYYEMLLDPFPGINPFAWQILAIFLRLTAVIALWWILRQVWPNHERTHFMISLLFLVYPGFTQQSIAMTYQYVWFFLTVLFLSWGIMLWGIRKSRYLWFAMTAACLLSAIHLFSLEYFFGLELLRPVFIWLILRPRTKNAMQCLRRTIFYYIPFLLVLGVYLYWRVFIFKFPSYQPVLMDQLRTAPFQGILSVFIQAMNSFKTVTINAWENVLWVPLNDIKSRFSILYPVIVVFSLIVLLFYQNNLPDQSTSETGGERQHRKFMWQLILIGVAAILIAGIPYYVTKLPVTVSFEHDRLTLAFIFGVSLLFTGLLGLLPRKSQSIALVSGLAALAIGTQSYYALRFSNETVQQNNFIWQLTWRAPALKQRTLILSDDATFPYTDDEALSFLINWTYSPENHTNQFAYTLETISTRLGNSLPALDKNIPVYEDHFAAAYFEGSTDQALALYYAPPSCLRILNPEYDTNLVFQSVWWDNVGQPHLGDVKVLPTLTDQALPLSNLDQIIPEPEQAAVPPINLIGPEPQRTWCYYFEKADLARQAEDWEQVARMGNEAMVQHSLHPLDLSEYLIFIEANLHLGQLSEANNLSLQIADWAPSQRPSLCAVWSRAASEETPQELQCNVP
jgi:hypothetical protein